MIVNEIIKTMEVIKDQKPEFEKLINFNIGAVAPRNISEWFINKQGVKILLSAVFLHNLLYFLIKDKAIRRARYT